MFKELPPKGMLVMEALYLLVGLAYDSKRLPPLFVFLLPSLILSTSWSRSLWTWCSAATQQAEHVALFLYFGLCCCHFGLCFDPCQICSGISVREQVVWRCTCVLMWPPHLISLFSCNILYNKIITTPKKIMRIWSVPY